MEHSRKRKRPQVSQRTASSGALQGITICGAALGVLLPSTASAQFTDCLDRMIQNDGNGDLVLTATGYESFISDMTDGKINLDMSSSTRTTMHEAFDVRLDNVLQGIDIAQAQPGAISQEGMELFCENVYESFFRIFNVTVTEDECVLALTSFSDALIDADDFASLASTLTGETFATFDDLGERAQDVYEDFEGQNGAVEGAFLGSRPQLPHLFCQCVVLGTRVDDDDFIPNVPGSQQSLPTQPPTTVLPFCLTELADADGNDDDLLSHTEYMVLLNELSLGGFLFETFDQLPSVLYNNYLWLEFGGQEIDIAAADSANTASEQETRQLRWVCFQTDAALDVHAGNATNTSLLDGVEPALIECVIDTLAADANIDGNLSLDEFIALVGSTGAQVSTEDMTAVFDLAADTANEIDISGAGRYQVPSHDVLLRFEELCSVIADLSTNISNGGNVTQTPTLSPGTTMTPTKLIPSDGNDNATFAPTYTGDSPTVPPTFFNDTSQNFTATPTIAPSSGNSTGPPSNETFPPTDVATPTISPSPGNSTFVPTSVSNITFSPTLSDETTAPPSGVNDMTPAPTLSPADYRLCTQSMLLCDRNRDNLMQQEEFVIFLNRQTGNKFMGIAFNSLDQRFRVLYDSLRGTDQYPSLLGSKPGQIPAPEQKEHLMKMCSQTDRAYAEYEEMLQFQPTASPTASPTDSPVEPGGIPDAELRQCKMFLLVSDSNRNLQLEQEEFVAFVNRLTLNDFLGRTYADMPPLFQDVFGAASASNGYISTVGVRGGVVPPEQEAALKNLCTESYVAARIWEEIKTETPTTAPTSPTTPPTTPSPPTVSSPPIFPTSPPLPTSPSTYPQTATPTAPPSLSVHEFVVCTSSLAVSDQDRNDRLDEIEYVAFLNRLTTNKYSGLAFSSIDLALRDNYFKLVGPSGTINIAGAHPGPRTEEQRIELLRVCSETDKIIEDLEQGVSPPISPTNAPTIAPTAPGGSLSDLELAQCQAFSSVFDADQSGDLDRFEYVDFINELTRGAVPNSAFTALDLPFQEAFTSSQSANGSVNLLGSSPGEVPPQLFISFCTSVFDALDDFNSRPRPTPAPTPTVAQESIDPMTLNCINSLDAVDFDQNDRVTDLEYVVLISQLSDGAYPFDNPFSSLPITLQDNLGWVSRDSMSIDVEGAAEIPQINGTIRMEQLVRVCRRTNEVLSSAVAGNNETNPVDHCYASLFRSDKNGDRVLDGTEYLWMVDYFHGLDPSSLSSVSHDDAFQAVLEANGGAINVAGSGPNDIPTPAQTLVLQYVCGELVKASVEAKTRYHLANTCFDALAFANTDANSVLSQDEYVDFVYVFANASRGSNNYADLPPELRVNFEEIQNRTPRIPGIDINGWPARKFSGNLQEICTNTHAAITVGFSSSDTPATYFPTVSPISNSSETPSGAATLAPSSVAGDPVLAIVYNGFLLRSQENLMLSDLRNRDFADLENAYRAFVNATVLPRLSGRRLRRRKLAVGLSYESVKVYRVLDGSCPDSTSGHCLEAYASFEMLLTDGENPDLISTQYTTLSRSKIADGSLQEQLELVSPNRRLDVVGLTESLRPGEQAPNPSPPGGTPGPTQKPWSDGGGSQSKSPSDNGSGTTLILLVLVVLVVLVSGIGFFFYRRRSKKKVAGEVSADNVKAAQQARQQQQQLHQPQSQSYDDAEQNNVPIPVQYDQNAYQTHDVVPPRAPASLLTSQSEHSVEPQFDFSPGGDGENGVYGRPSLQTIHGDENEAEFSPTSPADSYKGENPWGGMNPPEGLLHTAESDSSSSGDEFGADNADEDEGSSRGLEFKGDDKDHSSNSSKGLRFGQDDRDHSMNSSKGLEFGAQDEDPSNNMEEGSMYSDEAEDDVANNYMRQQVGGPGYPDEEDSDSDKSEADTIDDSYVSLSKEQKKIQMQYRLEVERLVSIVVPDEVENIDVMMEQFYGREEELIATLRNMAEQAGAEAASEEDESQSASASDESEEPEEDLSYAEESYREEQYEDEEVSYADEEVSLSQHEEEYDGEHFVEGSASQYDEETVEQSLYEEEVVEEEPSIADDLLGGDDGDSFVIEDIDMDEYYNKSFHIDNPFGGV